MSELSQESTADPPKKDDKDVESLAHDIERVCVSSEATGSERAKNKESSKNDIQESEDSEEVQSPTGRSGSKENKELTPLSQKTTKNEKQSTSVRKKLEFEAPTSGNENHTTSTPPSLDNTEENDLQSNEHSTTSGSREIKSETAVETILNNVSNYAALREEVKQYLSNPGSLPSQSQQQQQPFQAFPTAGGKPPNKNVVYLVEHMNEERRSTNNQLTRDMLKQPGIYYLKFTTSTGTCRGYVGESLNVYDRVGAHVQAHAPTLVDTRFKKTLVEEGSIEKWHLRVVMVKEIPVEWQKDLLKIYKDAHNKEGKEIKKKDLEIILTTIETLAMIDLNTVYPNGYNCKLEVSGDIWRNDPIVDEQ